MEVNQQGIYAVVDSVLEQTAAGRSVTTSEREKIATAFETLLDARQSALPAAEQTGFMDQNTLTLAVNDYLKSAGLSLDETEIEAIVDEAVGADDSIEAGGATLTKGAAQYTQAGMDTAAASSPDSGGATAGSTGSIGDNVSSQAGSMGAGTVSITDKTSSITDKTSGKDIVSELVDDGKIFLDRDEVGKDDKDESKPVTEALAEKLDNDPDFRKEFLDKVESGARLSVRYNADDTRVDHIHSDIMQIDIAAGDDIGKSLENALKEAPSSGVSRKITDTVSKIAGDAGLTGEEFVSKLEDTGTFSFTGENGDKMRQDVIYMYDHSDFMKTVMQDTLTKEPERKFNFSTIGEGGGTISTPFDDFSTTVVAEQNYDGFGEDYDSADNMGTVRMLAHEMNHSFLEIGDNTIMDVAGAVFGNELTNEDGSFTGIAQGDIAYIDPYKDDRLEIEDDFDADAFFKLVSSSNADNLSFEEIREEVGGIGVDDGIHNGDDYENALNGIVANYHQNIKFEDRTVPSLQGDMKDNFSKMIDYYLKEHPDADNEEVSDWLIGEITGRLPGVYPDGEQNTYFDERDDGMEAAGMVENYFGKHDGSRLLPELIDDVRDTGRKIA
jgi:hypothetical protein